MTTCSPRLDVYNRLMNNATKLFSDTIQQISDAGAIPTVVDFFEYTARKLARTDETAAAAVEAALCFAEGLDHTAVTLLADAGVKSAYRVVARMRIAVADAPRMYNLPGREAA